MNMENYEIIKAIENNEEISALKKQISDIEERIREEIITKNNEEKQRYKEWYNGLSEMEKLEEDIRVSKEKIKRLNEQKKRIKARQTNDDKRKERNHFLIVLGAEILSLCKKSGITITEDDVPAVSRALNATYKSGDVIFLSQLEKAQKHTTAGEQVVDEEPILQQESFTSSDYEQFFQGDSQNEENTDY